MSISHTKAQETELYYLRTRYYDPELGRFINADAYTSTDKLEKFRYPTYDGLPNEPEVICVDSATGVLYYAAADGMLRILTMQTQN